jgi:hypothetical protein
MIQSIRGIWTPVALVAAAAAVFGIVAVAYGAVSSLGIGSAETTPGGTVTVQVTASATAPGIGTANIDVTYDSSLVSLTGCELGAGLVGFCNPDFGPNTARLVGASATGVSGNVVIGTLTFQAGQTEGVANLTLTVNQLTDPEAVPLTVTPTNGTITIAQPTPAPTPSPAPEATPTEAPAATPTPTPAQLPETGGPAGDGSSTLAVWLLAALGLAVLGGGVWAVSRARR